MLRLNCGKLIPFLFVSASKKTFPASCSCTEPPLCAPKRLFSEGIRCPVGVQFRLWSSFAAAKSTSNREMDESCGKQNRLLSGVNDSYGGVTVEVKESMDPHVFVPILKDSIKTWKEQGKKGIWIKLPIQQSNLVHCVVQEGFRYHHAESDYLMLVRWLPDSRPTIPANASHRVGIGAFVVNDRKEVLVVQENSGMFKGTGVWKLPTGVVNEGEEIWNAAVREVKEETGIETKFVEVLAFRQSHKAFFTKSDLFFVCMLRPSSAGIKKDDREIEAAKWMSIEEYAAQPFVQKNQQFNYIAKICARKAAGGDCPGFARLAATSGGGKTNYLYCYNPENLQ